MCLFDAILNIFDGFNFDGVDCRIANPTPSFVALYNMLSTTLKWYVN